ncbi:MAG: allophanate hydrolase subunit 1 [Actinomycetales bacterium]
MTGGCPPPDRGTGDARVAAGGGLILRPVGDVGWLLEPRVTGDPVGDAATVLRLAEAVRCGPAGALAVDVVPAAATVLVTGPPARHSELGRLLAGVAARTAPGDRTAPGVTADRRPGPAGPASSVSSVSSVSSAESPGPVDVVLAVRFDGPDLADVAGILGLPSAGVVHRVTATVWTVAFTGFAPGFGYLVGGGLAVPRLDIPRSRVPAGSLGLAGPHAGVYPRASPGGWRLVGTLADPAPTLFDPARNPPALLPPGTRVRFDAAW